MKTMKKVFAFALAMVMMLAMTVTVFADTENKNATAEIMINNLVATGTNTVYYVKVLEADVKADGGYKFVEGVSVVKPATETTEEGTYTVAELVDMNEAQLQEALTRVNGGKKVEMIVNNAKDEKTQIATATVDAGLYAITATNTTNSDAIVYNNMAVSVEYDDATYVATTNSYVYDVKDTQKKNVRVAKYTTIPVTKVSTDTDKVVGISDVVTYNITTYIPSQVKTFTLTDVLSGATYVEGSVSVKVAGAPVENAYSFNNDGNLVIDLSKSIKDNEGKLVEVTYNATVTATVVNNTVTPDDGKHKFTSASEKLYTGTITITKYAADKTEDTLDDNTKLAGAGFVVAKTVNDVTSYATFTDNQLTGWVSAQADATVITTGDAGTVTVSGLDAGTYSFIEVVAPTGYSINNTASTATLELAKDATVATATLAASTYMIDSTLSALPATGGIGTMIFTIAGCAIMVVAAGLFFVSRRKNAR